METTTANQTNLIRLPSAAVNDPSLPSWECPAYQQQSPVWAYLDAVARGVDAWVDRQPDGTIKKTAMTQHFLPQFEKEQPPNYMARLTGTPFTDHFAQALNDFCGIVFGNDLRLNLPEPIVSHWQNIDRCGSAGKLFLMRFANDVMRLGHSFIMVDFPRAGKFKSYGEYLRSGVRPYWVSIHPSQVINWRTNVASGVETLELAVIRQQHMVLDQGWGQRSQVSYLVMRPGEWQRLVLVQDEDGRVTHFEETDRGFYRSIDGAAMPVPLIPVYGGLQRGFFQSAPPLRALADLNITHYRIKSDHLHKIHRCCFPVPVRSGTMIDEPELVLGVDTCVDIPIGGAFSWAEPSATSIQQSRTELDAIESQMDFLGAQYLVKPSDRQAALVSSIQATKIESSLQMFVQGFQSGINQALKLHARYLGITEPVELFLSTSFLRQQAQDANLLLAYKSLVDGDILSKSTFMKWLDQKGYLFDGFDPEAELQRVGEQVKVVAVGQMGGEMPADETAGPAPLVSPDVVISAYVDLAKAGVIPSEQAIEVIKKMAVQDSTSTSASTNGHGNYEQ